MTSGRATQPVRIRPAVRALPVYRPGRTQPARPGEVTYKLSSNENPFPPLPGVLEAVAAAARGLNRYPDTANTAITAAVAAQLQVPGERIAFGTGSVGVLFHLMQVLCEPGDEVVYAWRSFEAYPIAVGLTGATGVAVALGPGSTHDLPAMAAAVTPATRAVLLCSPNNPTGPALPHDAVVEFLDTVPSQVAVVLDEAYVEFLTHPGRLRSLELLDRPNVVVLRTFSKAYGLAGFRVGYCLAEESVATAVRVAALPFGVSVVAQAAVLASLLRTAELMARVGLLVAARDELSAGLRQHGWAVPDTQANFVWLPSGPDTLAHTEAFAEAGLSVRPFAVGDPADGIRITVGEPEANARVLEVAARLAR